MPQETQQTGEAAHPPSASSSSMHDSTFGVQSLEDAISESLHSENTWSRGDSAEQSTTHSPQNASPTAGRKRKVSYPPHPRLANTTRRHVSSELPSTAGSSAASPVSLRSSNSPFRSHLRRTSNSSLNLNRPLTPLGLSPNPESGLPGTPRSESVQSFRLSDEEASVASETNSQAIHSSSGDDDDQVSELDLGQAREPQLVMPSIAMPARRPFTTRGRNMGRLKVMVVGRSGTGKTSLIKSILRSCEDIVHVDSTPQNTPDQSIATARNTTYEATRDLTEIHASSRPYPLWWSDMESSRGLWRRKSFGEGILERNLCFVDTPGINNEGAIDRILQEIESLQMMNSRIENMTDNQLLNLFSGEGGTYVDVVLYLFDPSCEPISKSEQAFVKELTSRANFVPLIARADEHEAQDLEKHRRAVQSSLNEINAEWYSMVDLSVGAEGLPVLEKTTDNSHLEPFTVSSALTDDSENMDASLLMASDYLQPLAPSDLGHFLDRFLSPSNISRMRHSSARKFLLWRRTHLGNHISLPKQTLLQSPTFHPTLSTSSPHLTTDTGSLLSDPSKVLVPYHSNARAPRSPSPSSSSAFSSTNNPPNLTPSTNALAHHSRNPSEPTSFRQLRLAKWAQDLQRSLANDRKRYHPAAAPEWPLEPHAFEAEAEAEAENEKALVSRRERERPGRGRLGGEIAVVDPLGVLSLAQGVRRQGWVALRVLGGVGLGGAVVWCLWGRWWWWWGDVVGEGWLFGSWGGSGSAGVVGTPVAVPAPVGERGSWEGVGWGRW